MKTDQAGARLCRAFRCYVEAVAGFKWRTQGMTAAGRHRLTVAVFLHSRRVLLRLYRHALWNIRGGWRPANFNVRVFVKHLIEEAVLAFNRAAALEGGDRRRLRDFAVCLDSHRMGVGAGRRRAFSFN